MSEDEYKYSLRVIKPRRRTKVLQVVVPLVMIAGFIGFIAYVIFYRK